MDLERMRMLLFDDGDAGGEAGDPAGAGDKKPDDDGDEAGDDAGDKKTTTGEEPKGGTKSLMGGDDDDGKADGDGGEGKPDGSTGAPKEYAEFKLADGQEIDQDLLADVVENVFKKGGFTQEQAQAVIDLQHSEQERVVAARLATMEQWHRELKADPQVGPEFEANVARVKNFVRRLAGDEWSDMQDFFNRTGYGSHPPLFRTLLRAAKLISEDSLPGTSGDKEKGADGKMSEQDKLRKMYPSMFNEDGTPKNPSALAK